jgi:hypothetical protein
MIDIGLIGKDFEADGRYLMEVLSQNLAGGTDENQSTSVQTVGVPTEIRKVHFQNTSLDGYRYTNLISTKVGICEECSVCII